MTDRLHKVCFISPLGYGLYSPKGGYPFGGAEVQFYLLANQLAQDVTFEVSVLTTVREDSGREQYGALRVFTRKGRDRLALPVGMSLASWMSRIAGFLRAFLEMGCQLRQIDADVFLHAGAGVEVGAYALLCRLMRKRFIFFIASSADLSGSQGAVTGPLKWLFPLGVRLAHAVVCRTVDQQSLLQARYRRSGVLIRTGHPLPPRQAVPGPYVLWVGRGNPLKQPEMFLDLAGRMPRHRFVMVIAREDLHFDLLTKVRARAAMLGNLELYEDVSWSKIDNYFARARVFVNTSTYEGFPNTFVQAALHGAPVVSWRVDPDQLLSSRQLGLCAGDSLDRLVDLVQGLCESETDWRTLSQDVERYALTHHLLSVSAGALKALLCSLDNRSLSRLNQELSA